MPKEMLANALPGPLPRTRAVAALWLVVLVVVLLVLGWSAALLLPRGTCEQQKYEVAALCCAQWF